MSTTNSYTSTTVNELEPRYSCLVYPSASPNVQKGDPGAGCPYCTCYESPPVQFQAGGDWSQPLSKPGVEHAHEYKGVDTVTGNSYQGYENWSVVPNVATWLYQQVNIPEFPPFYDGGTI